MRRALRASQAAALVVAMMFVGSLVLWVGVPVAWLWVGWLSRVHAEIQERRGVPERQMTALELVLVASAVFAVVGFFVWFFGFSGSSPIPLQIGY